MHKPKRNNLIDALRFFAAVSVAIFHGYRSDSRPDNLYTHIFYGYGNLGVPMFFVISGYCILIALDHSKTSSAFIIRRFFRIFPPYWFSLLFTLGIILFLKVLTGANSVAALPKTAPDIALTAGLLTQPITKTAFINWVYWTLPYEMLFYVAVFLCSFLKNNYFTLLLILITACSCIIPPADTGFLSFFKLWPVFSIGSALFKLLHNDRPKQWLNVLFFCVSALAFYRAGQSLPYIVVSLLTLTLITIGHYFPLRDNKISRLGDLSYAIYLLHVPFMVYLFSRFRDNPPIKGNGLYNVLLDAVLLLATVFLAKAMHNYVELPLINYGKKLVKGKQAALDN